MYERWLKIIDNGKEELINESAPFFFLDANMDFPNANENDVTIAGVDGVLPGSLSYAPFNLILRFGLDAYDLEEFWLYEHMLRSKFSRRKPFTIIHSQLPGVKFDISKCDISKNIKDGSSCEFEVTCKVYKGYYESVYETDTEFKMSEGWMLEIGIPLDFTPKYKHKSKSFVIWNGSTDTIDPRMHHKLKIYIQLTASKGFELINHTTGDVFKYKKSIEKDELVLSSVYAYRNGERCGIDTNRGVITLAPGKNDFEIKGNVSIEKVQFKFPFIYR
ncbi:phage tail domain-containing protein [Staphylococcus pseudintermedius]|uniref:phage tail domain-containing protein n=1 Tax=Staphylococcus pseudintermedius TaxID=283734 RepID=UPI000C1C4E53|nr:phage tail domain-containing protein [Staphylococcus pseudintermedius]